MQQAQMGGALKNDLWITDAEEKADPKILPELLLPNSTKEDMAYLTTVGKVLSVGNLAYKDLNKFPEGAWCKEGDYVCYGKHAGTKLFYKGIRLILLFDDQIMMKIEDPKDLDLTFNLSTLSS